MRLVPKMTDGGKESFDIWNAALTEAMEKIERFSDEEIAAMVVAGFPFIVKIITYYDSNGNLIDQRNHYSLCEDRFGEEAKIYPPQFYPKEWGGKKYGFDASAKWVYEYGDYDPEINAFIDTFCFKAEVDAIEFKLRFG